MDDTWLLREYASHQSEEAFATLVSRHINLVYSVALRHVANPHHAEEITQAVFIILARKAAALPRRTILSGWLFNTAKLTATNFLRSEARRIRREQEAYMNSNSQNEGDSTWRLIAPLLDEAVASLGEVDRNAIVLRYFSGLSLQEVGVAMGASEDAAKKRVSRATEKLRVYFARHGAALSGTAITGAIAAESVQAAPASLAAAVTAASLKVVTLAASTSTLVKGTLNIMAWTKVKIAVAAGVAALVAVQWHEIASQRKQLALLRAQPPLETSGVEAAPVPAAGQEMDQLKTDKAELSNQVDQLRRQLAARGPSEPITPEPEVKLRQSPPRANEGRELGLALAQGDPAALDKLSAMAKAELASFNTNSAGLTDTARGDLARQTFGPLHEAFASLDEEAAKGNQVVLQALARALQMSELRALAVQSLGRLAGNGDEGALQVLLNPADYNVQLSSTVSALKPAADHGNQKAIDALAAVANDETKQALWFMAADGLGQAAESGNPVAIDALITLSSATNRSVQQAVYAGLTRAAGQSAKAADAVRQMGQHSDGR